MVRLDKIFVNPEINPIVETVTTIFIIQLPTCRVIYSHCLVWKKFSPQENRRFSRADNF